MAGTIGVVVGGCGHSDMPVGTTSLSTSASTSISTQDAMPRVDFDAALAEARSKGDDPAAVLDLHGLIGKPLSESQRKATHATVEDIVWHSLTDATTRQLYSELPDSSRSWSIVSHRLLGQSLAADDLQTATDIGARIRASGRKTEGELRRLLERVDDLNGANPSAIGVLLPLSGRGHDVGQQILQGIKIAARLSDADNQSIELIVEDAEAQAPDVAVAVAKMVREHRVISILGPASRKSSRQAAAAADRFGVPILTFTPDEKVTEMHDQAFRFFMSFEEEVEALVQAASTKTSRIAILYPDHAYGKLIASALSRALKKIGAEPCHKEAYEAGTSSFVDQVRAIKEKKCAALLMADRPTTTAILSATVATEDLPKDFQLLILSIGYSDTLAATSSRYLQGALVARPYVHDDTSELHREFVNAHRAEYGQSPSSFAAHGFDAYRLVKRHIADGDASRRSLSKSLRGAIAKDTLLSFGGLNAEKRPAALHVVYKVQGKTLSPWQP